MVSFFEGNFAIHSSPFSSKILAFGLAPPKEDPGAIKTASHFFTSSVSSSFSKFLAASCNSLMDDHGGVGFWLLLSKKGPLGSNLNRNAPIRLSSYTPNKQSIS